MTRRSGDPSGGRARWFYLAGLAVALVLAGVMSVYASSQPDGLEKVAEQEGFADTADDHTLADGPLGDYGVEGVADPRLAGGLAGVVGVGLTLAVGGAVFRLARSRSRRSGAPPAGPGEPGSGSGS